MSVLFDARVIARPHPSGIGLYAINLLRGLLAQKVIPITVFLSSWSETGLPAEIEDCITPPHHLVTIRAANKWLSTIWQFRDWRGNGEGWSDVGQPQLIHSPHLTVFRPTPAPRLMTVHDLAFLKFPEYLSPTDRLWHSLMARMACTADSFVVNSLTTKQDLLRTWQIPSSRVQVIYPGIVDPIVPDEAVDKHIIPAHWGLSPQQYLLYIGNLEPRKNLVRLVQAFDLLKAKGYAGLKLVLAGQPGYQIKELERCIQAARYGKDIVCTGYLTTADKQALLTSALAFAYLSLYEGFGLPILEAMAAGIPVLAANRASLPEVTGHAARLVDPESIESITKGMQAVVEDELLRKQLQAAGLERAKQFSWQKVTDAHLALYRKWIS